VLRTLAEPVAGDENFANRFSFPPNLVIVLQMPMCWFATPDLAAAESGFKKRTLTSGFSFFYSLYAKEKEGHEALFSEVIIAYRFRKGSILL